MLDNLQIKSKPHQFFENATAIAHFDKVEIWLEKVLSTSDQKRLDGLCGGIVKPCSDAPRYFGRMPRSKRFVQKIEVFQPSKEALEFLERRGDTRILFAEVAFNLIFADTESKDRARGWIEKHRVIKYCSSHGRNTRGTFYSGDNRYVCYSSRPCKVTNLPCVHQEIRLNETALQRLKIKTVGDLLALDQEKLWRKTVVFYNIDPARLGIFINNTFGRYRKEKSRRKRGDCDHAEGTFQLEHHSIETLLRLRPTLRQALLPIEFSWRALHYS